MDPSGIEPLSPRCKRGVIAIRLRAHVVVYCVSLHKNLLKFFFQQLRNHSFYEKILLIYYCIDFFIIF